MDPDEALRRYEAARANGDQQEAYDAAEALYGWLHRGGFRPRGYTQRKHAEVVAFYRENRALGRASGSGFKRTHALHIPGTTGYTLCGERATAKDLGSPSETTCYYCAHFWAKEHGGGTLVGGKGRARGKTGVHPPSCRCSSCSLFVSGKKGRSGGSAGAMTPEAVAHALREHLAPVLGNRVWRVNGPTSISPSVHVIFANVPRGASELDALNADKNAMISVSSAEWDRGSSAARAAQGPVKITASGAASYQAPPASLVTATQFSGRGMRMRKKSGTPSQVIAHVVKFFKEHA
jgi:hypothetical protein